MVLECQSQSAVIEQPTYYCYYAIMEWELCVHAFFRRLVGHVMTGSEHEVID